MLKSALLNPLKPSLYVSGAVVSELTDPTDVANNAGWWDMRTAYISRMFVDDAGNTPVASDGDLIGRVEDGGGQGNHMTQTATIAKPTYRAAGDGSGEGIGGDDYLQTGLVLNGSAIATGFTVVASVEARPGGIAFSLNDSIDNEYVGLGWTSSGESKIYSDGKTAGNGSNTYVTGTRYAIEMTWDGTTLRSYVNGTEEHVVVPSPAIDFSTLQRAYLFVAVKNFRHYVDNIFGATLYTRLLDSDERQFLRSFLS